jgi:hypothetical protein
MSDRSGTGTSRRAFLAGSAALAWVGAGGLARGQSKEVLPKHVTPEALRAVVKGLDYLSTAQSDDGSWIAGGGQAYPVAMAGLAGTAFLAHGNSPTRGKYAKNVQGVVEFLVRCSTPTGLITGPGQDNGMPMHGHGFALMFLASAYGMITKESLRRQVGDAVRKAVTLTSQGQSSAGGWTYTPGTGDEGSVTVTQVQASARPRTRGSSSRRPSSTRPRATWTSAGPARGASSIPSGRAAGPGCRSPRRPSPPSTTRASSTTRSPSIA